MRGKLWPVVAAMLTASCAGGPIATGALGDSDGASPDPSARVLAQSYRELRHGSLDTAEGHLTGLLARVDSVPTETYVTEGHYRRRAEIASGLAWIDIERGKAFDAKRKFNDTIRRLANDEQAHVAKVRERDEQLQLAQSAAAVGLIGLATAVDYRSVQAGTYSQSANALSALTTSGLITELSKPVDTTDQLVRFVKGATTDTDGVRMIVIPGFNGPLSVVGRVTVSFDGSQSTCTGAMVGRRAVLTAAHCFTRHGQRARESQVSFTVESANHRKSTPVIAIHTPTPVWRWGDFDNDWAILEVESNPAASQDFLIADDSLYPGASPTRWKESYAKSLYLAGYSSDLNDGRFLTLAAECSWVKMRTRLQGEHRCPSWKGASGAPVLVKHGKAGLESYHVLGVHVWGEFHNTPGSLRGMRLITKDVADVIRLVNRQ